MKFLRGLSDNADAACPDLILLDLNLPRKSGREVLQEVKADPHLRDDSRGDLTSSKEEEDVCRAYRDHANCYVTKPVGFEIFSLK